MERIYLWSVFSFVLSISPPILARPTQAVVVPIYFGTQDSIKEIQPITGTNYMLCHKHHSYYFFGGLYLLDDGYVLQEKVVYEKISQALKPAKYLPLTPEKIIELQQAGVLPNPLPAYSIPISDYISGYSFWGFLMLVAIYLLVRMLLQRLWQRYVAPEP
jgi:hypothetical protein